MSLSAMYDKKSGRDFERFLHFSPREYEKIFPRQKSQKSSQNLLPYFSSYIADRLMRYVLFFSLFLTSVFAQEARLMRICGTCVVTEKKAYIFGGEGTVWQVMPLERRWRGPIEWLRGDDLGISEDYLFNVADFGYMGDVEIYPRTRCPIDIANVSNSAEIHKTTHMLINKGTGRILFGTEYSFAQAMCEIHKDGYAKGLSEGKNNGYNEGYTKGKERGYQTGYAEGITKGKSMGLVSPPPAYQPPPPYQPPF